MEVTLIVITAVSLIMAAIMGAIAWRLARAEQRRSDARVAALAADLHDADRDPRPSHVSTPAGFFRFDRSERAPSRLTTVLAVGGFAVAMALAVIVVTGRSGEPLTARGVTDLARPAPSAVRAESDRAPLELIALGHDRDGDRITVRGIVRNPSGGVGLDQPFVVVFLFDRDGRFLGSGMAHIDVRTLAPGVESEFVVTVPNAADVGRYRVSFRSQDQIVPHVDHREPVPGRALK